MVKVLRSALTINLQDNTAVDEKGVGDEILKEVSDTMVVVRVDRRCGGAWRGKVFLWMSIWKTFEEA